MGDRITKLQGASTRPRVYKCKDCRKPFSVTVGTVMERSHILTDPYGVMNGDEVAWEAEVLGSAFQAFRPG